MKSKRQARNEAMQQLVFEIAYTFFRARAVADRIMGERQQTSGRWGLLNTLATRGPMTVAQIARSRPVARQGVQRLADALEEEGLVEYRENPEHRRSMLLHMTPRGTAALGKLSEKIDAWCGELAEGFDEKDLRTAGRVLHELRTRLAHAEPGERARRRGITARRAGRRH